jgi:hypothetical protein
MAVPLFLHSVQWPNLVFPRVPDHGQHTSGTGQDPTYQYTLRNCSFLSFRKILYNRSTTSSFVPPWKGILSPLSLKPALRKLNIPIDSSTDQGLIAEPLPHPFDRLA